MDFNVSQKKAIEHKEGPMLVLAGPGSGKTAVITHRTKYLIEENGISPLNILVITFTKAAAQEMKERFRQLMGEGVSAPVNFGTFHAIFFTILKYAYGFRPDNIIREEQRQQIFREIIQQLELELDDEKEFISGISSEISLVKGERMSVDYYYSTNCPEEIFKQIYKSYDNRLRTSNLIDFDDMLVMCYELLKARPEILALWQKKFRYILIDEFQDINKVQYEIIRMLAKPEDNLFIVGDDDQSIYRFRGAKPEIMLNFEKDYPESDKVVLDINYRSSGNIVEAAGRVIKNNKNRFHKKIITVHSRGEEVNIRGFKELKEENEAVVERIKYYREQGISLNQMVVLYRTNTQPRALIEKLMEYNLPFKMRDSIPNIYEHWIARNLEGYIKIAMGSRDRGVFLQIINRPKRYVGRDCFSDPVVEFSHMKEYYSEKDWMIERIEKLEYDVGMLSRMEPYAAINYIRKGIGYEEYLEEYAKFRRIKLEELVDVLDEIQEASRPYKTFEEWFEHIRSYSEELKEQVKKRNNKEIDSISMMTMHGSKGLEYEAVFIIDANEGITPHHKAVLEADLEEERRMFYVAMTRAKKYLHIFSVKERYGKELTVSRYVGEILLDQELLVPGIEVEHKMYGKGVIKKKKDGVLTVYFKRLNKERNIDLQFCISNRLLKI